MVKNLFDQRIKENDLRQRVEIKVKSLEEKLAVAQKFWAYANTTREAFTTAKNLAQDALAGVEAKKKAVKDNLSTLHSNHTQLEAKMTRIVQPCGRTLSTANSGSNTLANMTSALMIYSMRCWSLS